MFSRILSRRLHTSTYLLHENPLGLPKRGPGDKEPGIPRRSQGLPMKQKIPNVDKIILVSSAKGGVGKSTVSCNIALGLHNLGKRVGILDTDVFGPSIPSLMNLSGEPRIADSKKLLPMSNYGVQTMSMGYLVPSEHPVVWRGLMVMKAMQQLLFEVEWSPLDYLVVDMPPGTGDTQLTISQQLMVSGSIIVTTPQDIALLDAIKGIKMFRKVNIPILGLVENMSSYICPNCHHESHIFGSDGPQKQADKHNLELLGSIPISEVISLRSDKGKPIQVSEPDSPFAKPYIDIARKIISKEK